MCMIAGIGEIISSDSETFLHGEEHSLMENNGKSLSNKCVVSFRIYSFIRSIQIFSKM